MVQANVPGSPNWLSFLEHASPNYIQHALDVGVDILRSCSQDGSLVMARDETRHATTEDLQYHLCMGSISHCR